MKPEQIALAWTEAFNRHDVDVLVGLYAKGALHTSPKLRAARPETEGCIVGKAALRAWWQEAFDRLPGLHYELKQVTASPQRVFIEYLRHAPLEEPMAVAEVFEVRKGLIVASTVYHG